MKPWRYRPRPRQFHAERPRLGAAPLRARRKQRRKVGDIIAEWAALRFPIWGGYQFASNLQIYGAGASYAIGSSTVRFVYTNTRFGDIAQALNTQHLGRPVFNNYEVN